VSEDHSHLCARAKTLADELDRSADNKRYFAQQFDRFSCSPGALKDWAVSEEEAAKTIRGLVAALDAKRGAR
jgi:hypothetical protein